MKPFGGWKWNAVLAVFGAFTTLVVCWPRPSTRAGATIAQPAPTDFSATMPPSVRPDPTPAERDDMLQYTVQAGDTMAEIARLFVVSEEEIRRANHIPEDRDFTPGDKILIPSPPDPTPAEVDDMLRYTVQEGDTVASIARLFVVSEDELRRVNHVPDGDELAPGRMIWIPAQ